MTDAEINLSIAKIEYPDDEFEIQAHCSDVFSEHWADTFNYVNDWADIGPIIERERMKIVPLMKKYRVSKGNVSAQDHSLTKAAALCYLKIKGVEA